MELVFEVPTIPDGRKRRRSLRRQRDRHRRHVLPNHQPEMVGPVIPARRLDIDVFAHRVEPETLLRLQIELQGIVGWRGVEAIRPEYLIEQAELEDELAV